jgi:organic radical activating enzyme
MIDAYKTIGLQVAAVRKQSLERLATAALKVLTNKPLFDIEVASSCNIACSFCPRTNIHRQAKVMSPEIFSLILKRLPQNATVMFAGLGEPLLNQDIAKYVASLKARQISACIITNGILLTPERQQQLINAGIDQVQISYSGISDFTLNLIMGTTKYKSIIDDNLQNLAAIRSAGLRIQLNFVLMPENQNELSLVETLAKSLGFDLYIRRVHNRGGHYNINSGSSNNIKSSCGIHAAVTFITVDGKILACSNDVPGSSSFKFIADTNWEEIVAWKKQTLSRELLFSPCANCSDDYRWLILDYLSVDKKA